MVVLSSSNTSFNPLNRSIVGLGFPPEYGILISIVSPARTVMSLRPVNLINAYFLTLLIVNAKIRTLLEGPANLNLSIALASKPSSDLLNQNE